MSIDLIGFIPGRANDVADVLSHCEIGTTSSHRFSWSGQVSRLTWCGVALWLGRRISPTATHAVHRDVASLELRLPRVEDAHRCLVGREVGGGLGECGSASIDEPLDDRAAASMRNQYGIVAY